MAKSGKKDAPQRQTGKAPGEHISKKLKPKFRAGRDAEPAPWESIRFTSLALPLAGVLIASIIALATGAVEPTSIMELSSNVFSGPKPV